MVTATLPAFARQGTPIDVTISSMGDARSLNGGSLVATPLLGADGEVYAVAQGPLVVGGFQAQGQAQSITQGVTTSARIPGGAIVEREVRSTQRSQQIMRLALRSPDYTTAIRIEEVVNRKFGRGTARVLDMGTIEVNVPGNLSDRVPLMVSQMENLEVRPEVAARVVVDARTGTIVVGARVRIEPVAITHGNMVIRVTETPIVSQPNALAGGQTVVVPRTQIDVDDQRRNRLMTVPRANTLQSLVNGLNALGLAPRDLISVLNALKAAGALHADLEFI
jgi:flagellar P-ring protein precursor FlgI